VALVVGATYCGLGKLVTRCGGDEVTVGDVRATVLVVVVALLSTMTLLRNFDYRSELALWRDVAEKAPHNPRGQYNFGVYLQLADPPDLDGAIRQYERTLELEPGYADAHLNLGNLAAYREQWSEARMHYEHLLALQPTNATALYGIAQAAEKLDDPIGAKTAVDKLLEVDPNHADGKALRERLEESAAPSTSR
jgi:tetratricopeptide (TPR) repeat protein